MSITLYARRLWISKTGFGIMDLRFFLKPSSTLRISKTLGSASLVRTLFTGLPNYVDHRRKRVYLLPTRQWSSLAPTYGRPLDTIALLSTAFETSRADKTLGISYIKESYFYLIHSNQFKIRTLFGR